MQKIKAVMFMNVMVTAKLIVRLEEVITTQTEV